MGGGKLRVAILPCGSRGDFQPYCPLVGALRASAPDAIDVELWAPTKQDGTFVRTLLPDECVRSNDTLLSLTDLAGKLSSVEDAGRTGKPSHFQNAFGQAMKMFIPPVYTWVTEQIQRFKPHLLVVHPVLLPVAVQVRDMFGTPFCFAHLVPFKPTNEFAPTFLAPMGIDWPLCGLNFQLHKLIRSLLLKASIVPELQHVRTAAGLPPLTVKGLMEVFAGDEYEWIHGYSPLVAPKCADWSDKVHVTGYWIVPAEQQLQAFPASARLSAFLAAGPPPVYIGWGSMKAGTAKEMATIAVEASRAAGVRAVVLGGRANLDSAELDEENRAFAAENMLFCSESLPHEWLLPRCAAAVHHGGAGSTAASLRAGRPTIITPVIIDQFFWARRVNHLGVGHGFTKPLLRIGSSQLGEAIKRCVNSEVICARATSLADKLNSEDGPGCAAAIIYRLATECSKNANA
ncbi:hypothetical protein AB1Y20_009669 [Prymnesium parvum]|uniref:Erythromycin biosynthesis protein CIII-like C-terminal domain-containing protein n=1 Tax=Prymnesium parvum TaxID=97485 RepID=A0AB34K112_PRYPA|mmetsp:Transcript_4927/g.12113  ORF Transcript_4927/g.12113 Transcript_4927/m.12113 type:complete len:459 (+) Transcript_4927:35-1411(+)